MNKINGLFRYPGFISIVCIMLFSFSGFSATYYFDSMNGNDNSAGTAKITPWKTLTKFNATTFLPGDTILIKCGSVYTGLMQVKGSGTAAAPIVINKYDVGPLPRIDGGGIPDAVLVSNVDYWEINNLEVTNQSAKRPTTRRSGVNLTASGVTRHHLQLRGLYVHDVNGDTVKGPATEGCGIYFNGGSFDDILIENCHVVKTDRNGICQYTTGSTRSTNVVIRGNLLENIGGDCIKLWGTNHGLIEHNIVRGGHMTCIDAAAGIWPFSSDSCIIQFNEVSGMKTCVDGNAFDIDYGTRGTIVQYNYSHDNDGGFILLCSPGNSYSTQYIVRYNVSQNDGIDSAHYIPPGPGLKKGCIFYLGGHSTAGQIYNNTIYVPSGRNIYMVYAWNWSNGIADSITFSNNIFWVEGSANYDMSIVKHLLFQNNVFYSALPNSQPGCPLDSYAITIKPPLKNPGNADSGFGALNAYSFTSMNTGFAGRAIPNNGGRDILGNTVSPTTKPLVGAVQSFSTPIGQESFYQPDSRGPWMKITSLPGSRIHSIIVGSPDNQPASVVVVNTRGQLVRSVYNGIISKNERRFFVDAGSFSTGMYFVKLSTPSGGYVAGNIFIGR